MAELKLSYMDKVRLKKFEPRGQPAREVAKISIDQLRAAIQHIDDTDMQEEANTVKLFGIFEKKFKLNVRSNWGVELGSNLESVELAEQYVLKVLDGDADDEVKVMFWTWLSCFIGNCLVSNYQSSWVCDQPGEPTDYIQYPTDEGIDIFSLCKECVQERKYKVCDEYREITFKLQLLGY
ncbi:MAG TPA: hypothetical protein VEJ63_21645 [Planctomycetota bacterium]|nr:hypothetical protein [Planctomycetota bacterium]